ncbi:uncharacterized protein TRAVEDRAFT_58213 [Trametes versicolor FP-101664 SS1]|uniref:uncharacterized protein n=1 Tax=Trametes versicolor (strain FP-101664) TaxID=717944 RepID=UPI000462133D|nr:uncharacterized protein TRAVEDRAFT_58213 [Trametes versicolor FP-101664 SS1]EIW59319.1 hypothetical protein TRAVEDRAFT_58213 [Trametes versicolor FP-101664 SS1]
MSSSLQAACGLGVGSSMRSCHMTARVSAAQRSTLSAGLLSPDVLRLCTLSAPRKHAREGDCAPCAAAPVAPGRHVVPRLQLQATPGNLDRLRRRRGPPSQEPVAGKDAAASLAKLALPSVCLSYSTASADSEVSLENRSRCARCAGK